MLLGQPLVVFRTTNGQPAVLEDRCAHRHAPLSAGRVCSGELECPYHGWRYGGSGEVKRVPALGEATAPPDVGVTAMPACEQDGLIWCWPGETPPPGPPLRIATHDAPGFTRFIMKTRFRSSVAACLENFLDCPHATFVHRGWFRSPTGQPVRAMVTTLEDGAVAEYFDEPRKASVIWALFAPSGGAMHHTDRFIAPHTSCVDYVFPSGIAYNITSICAPLETGEIGEIEVFTVMSFRFGVFGSLVRLAFEPISRWIIRQDVKMLQAVARNQERFAERFAAQGTAPRARSTSADLLGPHIWAWRQSLARGLSPPPAGEVSEVTLTL